MSNSIARSGRLSRFYDWYKLYVPEYGLNHCYYCGQPADTYDHVPPLIIAHYKWSLDEGREKTKYLLVPSCRECNTLLGSCIEDKPTLRKKVLKRKLKKRYKGKILGGNWTVNELDSMGPDLRRYIELGVNLSEYLKRRLAW